MNTLFKNMVFEGGGVWGIAYLGMLDYLYHNGVFRNIGKVAGTSAGAITACILSFNLPFNETLAIADSLDYGKVPGRGELLGPGIIPSPIKTRLNKIFGDIDSVYRLIKYYGWYSSDYFYDWIKTQIANQFNPEKKAPPYTFADFREASLHKDNRPFLNLYVIGTDLSNHVSSIFCYENTPYMEVAEAVRISMSIPLFFQAVKSTYIPNTNGPFNLYTDGGIMYNYPINIFDNEDLPEATLGGMFKSDLTPRPITSLVDFISNVLSCATAVQLQIYTNDPQNLSRSIQIETKDIKSTDFNIKTGDNTYNFLYRQGYIAAKSFFEG